MLHPYAHAIWRSGRRRPDDPAVVDVAGDRRLTWGELVSRAGRLAGALRRAGVGPGDRVCVVQANRAAYVEAVAATAWLGAAFVPVLGGLTVRERDEIIAMVRPSVVIDTTAANPFGDLGGPGDRGSPGGPGDWVPPVQADPSTTAQILFTSGSTGTPKGVMHSFAGSRAVFAAWVRLVGVPGPPPRVLVTTPISHAAGRLLEAALPLGGTVVIQDGAAGEATLATIARFGVTHMLVVPTVLRRMVDEPSLASHDLSSLRFVLYSAAPAAAGLVARAHTRLGEVLHTVWGSTELPAPNTHLGPAEHARGVAGEPRLLGSCGREFASDVQLRVVDDRLRDVPAGEPGQVIAAAGWLASGYWDRPDLWASRLHGDWFLTGDIGRVDDEGYLYLSDRVDDLIITGGSNVYPTEIETAVAEHPDVSEVSVVGLPDPQWGEAVTAVVVLRPGAAASAAGPGSASAAASASASASADAEVADAVLAHCRAHLARHKVPKRVIVVDELPRNPLGKVSRRAVRATLIADTDPRPGVG